MASLKERLTSRLARLRERRPSVDHAIRTVLHYGDVRGNDQAGAVTFFGFLSFFPIMALAFFVVGYLSAVYPELRLEVVTTVEKALPGVIGTGEGKIPLETFEENAGRAAGIGAAGLLYSGLGWISGMRRALAAMFKLPETEHPNFLVGKLRDLRTLVLLGVIMLVSLSLSAGVSWFSELILGWMELDGSWLAAVVLWVVTHALAIGATTLLFLAMFRFLAQPHIASRALWQGAFAGAVGFEVLKAVAAWLIALSTGGAAAQTFGVALILLVWINYFSRLVMVSAAWAYTAPVAQEVRELEEQPLLTEEDAEVFAPAPAAVVREDPQDAPLPVVRRRRRRLELAGAVSAVGAAAVGVLTWVTRRNRG